MFPSSWNILNHSRERDLLSTVPRWTYGICCQLPAIDRKCQVSLGGFSNLDTPSLISGRKALVSCGRTSCAQHALPNTDPREWCDLMWRSVFNWTLFESNVIFLRALPGHAWNFRWNMESCDYSSEIRVRGWGVAWLGPGQLDRFQEDFEASRSSTD